MPISPAKRRCSSTSRPTMSCAPGPISTGTATREMLDVALHVGRVAEHAARGPPTISGGKRLRLPASLVPIDRRDNRAPARPGGCAPRPPAPAPPGRPTVPPPSAAPPRRAASSAPGWSAPGWSATAAARRRSRESENAAAVIARHAKGGCRDGAGRRSGRAITDRVSAPRARYAEEACRSSCRSWLAAARRARR